MRIIHSLLRLIKRFIKMEPVQAGDCVRIGPYYIPAVNIQVENVPGYLRDYDKKPTWYGIYFEINFASGALWIVEKGSTEGDFDGRITVTEYPKWAITPDLSLVGAIQTMLTWEEFVALYYERINMVGY